MRGFVSIIIGLIIICIVYFLIRKELNNSIIAANSKYSHINDDNTRQILKNLDSVEDTVNELNRSFYEVASDLEGKYSVHEKEIELINTGFKDFNRAINNKISSMEMIINTQNEIIQKLEKAIKKSETKDNNQILNLKEDSQSDKELMSSFKEKSIHIDVVKNESMANINSTYSQSTSSLSSSVRGSGAYIESLNDFEKEKLRDKIIELRQQGFTLSQIAKKLGVGVGELQLVLNLQRK